MTSAAASPTPPPRPFGGRDGRLVVLGIETSCDETAASVVVREADGAGRILSNVIRSQWSEHQAYGGVVPEIAARAHMDCLDGIIAQAMADAGISWADLNGVAVTAGPGLIGGLIVGLTTAKMIALAHALPLVALNHLEAHALTVGLTDAVAPPYALLLVSGGHTQIVHVEAIGRYRRLATTIDDALGEAFDKTAKLLGLGQPGGPAVARLAADGNPSRFDLPRPMFGRPEPHFSFAGLKTAVRQRAHALADENGRLATADIADLCASFEAAVCASVADRVGRALQVLATDGAAVPALVVAGGVAANVRLRATLADLMARHGLALVVPPSQLCTDNGAMIAWAGAERLARGWHDDLGAPARARWPLDTNAVAVIGSGRLGAKA